MSLRSEFVARAQTDGVNLSALCRQYQISRKTGYKWLHRARTEAEDPLANHSRRPHVSPHQTGPAVTEAVLALRARHPHWGARKLARLLAEAGATPVPAPSTITVILQRHGVLPPRQPRVPQATHRFEHPGAHDLWQMDFMGPRATVTEGEVHPLTIIDDHSRTLLSLTACLHQRLDLVWEVLWACFTRYGLPRAILTDNGPPWGQSLGKGMNRFEARLLRMGIEPWHGRPYHPQTQGKVERMHATIAREVFGTRTFATFSATQYAFDTFRTTYNEVRPHEGIAYAVPISRLQPNARLCPDVVPPPVYAPHDAVRKVRSQGAIGFAGRSWFVSRGLIGEEVAVRPTDATGGYGVWFCHRQVGAFNIHRLGVTCVSEQV